MAGQQWDVLIPEELHESGPNSLRDIAELTRVGEIGTDEEDLIANIHTFDAVLLRGFELREPVLNEATDLKVVSKHGIGLDSVDIDAATANEILVCNTPRVSARSVGEHAVSLLLAVRKNLLRADSHVRHGGWERHRYTNREFDGDTLGLYGLGTIAREVATMAAGLGFECVAYDPYVPEDEFPSSVEKIGDESRLFEVSDVVTVHVPLTSETKNAISKAELATLGEDGILVNTARGEVVDEAALVDALEREKIGGAGLDVMRQEPPGEDSRLFELDNVVLTPHMASLTHEAFKGMSTEAAANIRTVYDGDVPESAVNAEAAYGD
jgi:D-3-phosphoglycerate dehydrogenase